MRLKGERMLEVFDMHGRAGLKPAIPARNMPRPLLKLSSLNASTTSKLTPSPPSCSAPSCEDGEMFQIPWLDVAIFNEANSHFFLDIGDKSWPERGSWLSLPTRRGGR